MCDKKIICKGACKLVNFDCMWVSTQDMIVASVYLLHTILQSYNNNGLICAIGQRSITCFMMSF